MENKYDDIINRQRWEPRHHKRMQREARAPQFSPFAALTGYDEEVKESARLTELRNELAEDEKSQLDYNILELKNKIETLDGNNLAEIEITYFKPDTLKSGGEYIDKRGRVKKIEEYDGLLVFEDGTIVSFADIYSLKLV